MHKQDGDAPPDDLDVSQAELVDAIDDIDLGPSNSQVPEDTW